MAPKRVLAAIACVTLVTLSAPALADDQYRADEFFGLDLSKAALSPKRLGPPAEFAPVPVEARSDTKRVKTTRITRPARVERQAHVERPAHVKKPRLAKSRTPARARLAHRHGNPLDAQAMDRSIQTWPCRSGGICNWKR
jgi:hypothetical protein